MKIIAAQSVSFKWFSVFAVVLMCFLSTQELIAGAQLFSGNDGVLSSYNAEYVAFSDSWQPSTLDNWSSFADPSGRTYATVTFRYDITAPITAASLDFYAYSPFNTSDAFVSISTDNINYSTVFDFPQGLGFGPPRPPVNETVNLDAFLNGAQTVYVRGSLWTNATTPGSSNTPEFRIIQFGATSSEPVPEPASIAMWGIGALGMAFARRKRRQMKLAA
jgi:hypothetical protein